MIRNLSNEAYKQRKMKNMKENSSIIFGMLILILLTANFASAQDAPLEKRIKVVKGQKLILKDEVYEATICITNFMPERANIDDKANRSRC
jgi:hypothetical protein